MRIETFMLLIILVVILQCQLMQISAFSTTGGSDSRFSWKQNKHIASSLTMADGTSADEYNNDGSVLVSRRNYLTKMVTATMGSASLFGLSTTTPYPANAAAVADITVGGKIVYGSESIMSPKEHGTSSQPVQENLLYGVSNKLADKICNYNRHFAEFGGYAFQPSISFQDTILQASGPITFYDSVTGKPLFVAPIGRTAEQFIQESQYHGWPSFRDTEVVWDNVRILSNGETVSVDGTHLGHNLPDKKGNRYCINLVSIAGQPISLSSSKA